MDYVNSILNKFNYISEDFSGLHLDLFGFYQFLLIIIFSLVFFLILYLVGEKLRSRFFSQTNNWTEKYFIDIALGYIAFGTGLTFIGLFSLLTPFYLSFYILAVSLFIIFSIKSLRRAITELVKGFVAMKWTFKNYHFWPKVCITLFIFLTFLRLLPPEIGADAMNYHTTFPKLYLFYNTFRLDPGIHIAPIAIPQLGEMPYIITVFFNLIDASRYIHFGFYLLCVLLLLSPSLVKKNTALSFYIVLLFVTCPIVLHYATSAYSDFPNIFCFILAVLILIKEKVIDKKNLYLSAIIFGGALATKAFSLLYIPSFVLLILYNLYKTKKLEIKKVLSYIVPFILIAISFPIWWYIHSYLLFGNPYSFYSFSLNSTAPQHVDFAKMFMMIFNWTDKLTRNLLFEYSPLIYIGIVGTIFSFKKVFKQFLSLPISIYVILFLVLYLFFPPQIYLGRYFLPVFTILAILVASGMHYFNKNIFRKSFFIGIVVSLFIYFLINTLAILPYGIGLAKKENYITRILIINPTAYYDFDRNFSPYIGEKEIVATYNLDQFYYATFIPNNIYHFLNGNNKSIADLKKQNVTKLIIRGGDINWFCENLHISNCDKDSVTLLTSSPKAKQYLYQIND